MQAGWGPTDVPLSWSFEPVVDIGGQVDGPAAFGRVMPSGIGVDGEGRIHVLDVLAFRVSVFDRSGDFIRSVGRSGSGPGEFRFPSDLAVRADGAIAVYDFDGRAFVVFDADGSPLDVVPAPGPLMRRAAFGEHGITGSFVVESGSGDAATIQLTVRNPGDTVSATLASVAETPVHQVDFGCAVVGFRSLLGPRLVWSANGQRTAVVAGTDYTITIFAGTRPIGRWSRAFEPLAGTVALAAAELGGDSLRLPGPGGCRLPVALAAERIGFADTAPHIFDLAVSPDGGLWVARLDRTGVRSIDVWSADGDYLGTLPPTAPFPAAFRGPDEIVTVERDSLGVARVRIWRITRS
jgi:hypothetical protein